MELRSALLILLFSLIIGCTASTETTQENREPDFYVFDDVEKIDTVKSEPEAAEKVMSDSTAKAIVDTTVIPAEKEIVPAEVKYIIQLGAFSTRERAEQFIIENQSKISFLMNLTQKGPNKLYTVHLSPFKERVEAESVRNTIWKIPVFKDAFIVTEQ
ncbi:MAG TPA: SPOR domain-containing protein [Melioribacteraceae bacterium]|nr:SPOR domain-containing protein [Melioribacteraceae bacterium]